MDVALWVVQGILAVVFLGSGIAKGTMTKARMIETGQTGVRELPLPFIRFIAGSELLGVAGLLLPGLLHVAEWLTPVAASGLFIVMVAAGIIHLRMREPKNALTNAVLLSMCLFVIVGRTT